MLMMIDVRLWFGLTIFVALEMIWNGNTVLQGTNIIGGMNTGDHMLPTCMKSNFVQSVSSNKNKTRIRQISILGERNSGTRWTYRHLVDCFNYSTDIEVKRDLTRYKHWFQYYNRSRYHGDTLVIAMFRNPHEWVEAMRTRPHHAPNHFNLSWQEFLTKPWNAKERVGLDLEIDDMVNPICQQKFRYNEVNSCVEEPLPKEYYANRTLKFSENQPFYELRLDGSGLPYKNILELRAAKIRNFLDIANWKKGIHDVWKVQYEHLKHEGTKKLLDQIANETGIPYICKPEPKQKRPVRNAPSFMLNHINENLDWDAEALIGYYPEDVQVIKRRWNETETLF